MAKPLHVWEAFGQFLTYRAEPLQGHQRRLAQVDSYSFGFPTETGDAERVMLPLLDLINHKGDANTAVTESEDKMAYLVLAIKNIRCHVSADCTVCLPSWS